MKFPKLIGNLTPGAAIGFSQAKALQNTGAPFLTASAPGVTTRTKNGFTEVETTEAADLATPYIWAMHSGNTTATAKVNVSVPGGYTKRLGFGKPLKVSGTLGYYGPLSTSDDHRYAGRGLYVGAGKIALPKFFDDSSQGPIPLTVYGALTSATSRAESTAFYVGGSTMRSLFATGWDTTAGDWRWGFSTRAINFEVPGVSGYPSNYARDLSPWEARTEVHVGSVRGEFTSTFIPGGPANRMQFCSGAFCVGPGKLAALTTVIDYVNPTGVSVVAHEGPHLALSNDHGLTWSVSTASWLNPYVRTATQTMPDTSSQSVAFAAQSAQLGRWARFIYLGEGKSLLVLPFGAWISGAEHPACFTVDGTTGTFSGWAVDGKTPYAPVGAVYPYTTPGSIPPLISINGWALDGSFATPTSECFGVGCVVVRMAEPSDPFNLVNTLRVTYDFGASWTDISVPSIEAWKMSDFIPLSPYVNPDKPGALIALVKEGANTVAYRTTGLFDNFRRLGVVVRGAVTERGVFVNKRHSLYPALPGEFNAP